MDRSAVKSSYAQSLLWMALLIALAQGTALIVELIFVDFIHGNPNRPQSNAFLMMIITPPVTGILSIIGSLIIFFVPQCFQFLTTAALASKFGRISQIFVLAMLPITSLITWYCYDYLTSSDFNLGINVGADWTPYEHGLTLRRYLMALAIQAPVTMFTLLHCDGATRHRSNRRIILSAFAIAICVGGLLGHRMAENQFQFIDRPKAG